jgi:catechol 2,3-dioxygenase-like lactoylglutathione lyase family enzyme
LYARQPRGVTDVICRYFHAAFSPLSAKDVISVHILGLGSCEMFTYLYLGTNDLGRAIDFYDAALSAFGHKRCVTGDPEWDRISAGWGLYEENGLQELALWVGKPFDLRPASAGNGSMVAFKARSWKEVDDFHAAALAHGGTCEGAPGLRPQYNADFYAAYVRDLDGNKLAAVCRGITGR